MGGEQQTRVKAIRCREYTPGFIKVMQRIRNYEAANSTFRFRIISEASMPKAKKIQQLDQRLVQSTARSATRPDGSAVAGIAEDQPANDAEAFPAGSFAVDRRVGHGCNGSGRLPDLPA